MPKIHFEILDRKRRKMLPGFTRFKDKFYLAGGTGLALQFAHRDSIDFDFFTPEDFNPEDVLREVRDSFKDDTIEVIQAGNKTLNLIIAGEVKVSFFCIKEKLLTPPLDAEYFNLASLEDIACMKITALLRAEFKDYVDLYYIFKIIPLEKIISLCKKKYQDFDEMVYLKALTSFDDLNQTDILFERGKKVKLKEIKTDFVKRVKAYLR